MILGKCMKDDMLCPITETIKVIGTKWRLITIRHLNDSPRKFNELKRLTGVSPKTLSRTLKYLEDKKIVKRTLMHTSPVSVQYSLTKMGEDLNKILKDMGDWGAKWVC